MSIFHWSMASWGGLRGERSYFVADLNGYVATTIAGVRSLTWQDTLTHAQAKTIAAQNRAGLRRARQAIRNWREGGAYLEDACAGEDN